MVCELQDDRSNENLNRVRISVQFLFAWFCPLHEHIFVIFTTFSRSTYEREV